MYLECKMGFESMSIRWNRRVVINRISLGDFVNCMNLEDEGF